MNMRKRTGVAVTAMVAGCVLAAGVAVAGGGNVRQRNGSGYGSATRSGSSVTSGTQDRTRDRLKDGTCILSGDKLQERTRDRLKDGSCL